MIIDIISDLHFDTYFDEIFDNELELEVAYDFYDPFFLNREADLLIIAGDLGHINRQNINLLKMFQQRYYQHIVMVAGNHDYLLYSRRGDGAIYSDSIERINDFKLRVNNIDGLYFLDGNVVTIDEVRFGGSMGWYDGSYVLKNMPHFHPVSINVLWRECMPDSRAIIPMKRYNDFFKDEYQKIKNVSLSCDVMITHINPSSDPDHTHQKYRNENSTAFYTFDGDELLQATSAKYWIYGHTHLAYNYKLHDVDVICNPFGYPQNNEYDHIMIKTITV